LLKEWKDIAQRVVKMKKIKEFKPVNALMQNNAKY
jgi:hypothetical protein